jgi:hypothetical protein
MMEMLLQPWSQPAIFSAKHGRHHLHPPGSNMKLVVLLIRIRFITATGNKRLNSK